MKTQRLSRRYFRMAGLRKTKDEAASIPHCGSILHWNGSFFPPRQGSLLPCRGGKWLVVVEAMRDWGRFFGLLAITVILCSILLYPISAAADPDKATFMSPLVWRGDGEGDYTFAINSQRDGTAIAADGSVAYSSSPGTYELKTPYVTDGTICGISANWSFTGEVTMEVSATGRSEDYVPVINGVPLEAGTFIAGAELTWRATLQPGSALTGVTIAYMDLSGVISTFGNPGLSGFMFRKPVYITGSGSASSSLFHYQIPIRIGESAVPASAGTGACQVRLRGVIQANFADVRFTQADGETFIPYWLEEVSGTAPGRTALFWLNIPEIPPEGLLIYAYYGNPDAEDLSDGEKVFDFFDDFDGALLDEGKWSAVLDTELSVVALEDSAVRLDGAKIISFARIFGSGIIEYKAKTSGNAPVACIIRAGSGDKADRIAYSSKSKNSQHCIVIGEEAVSNTPEAISRDTFYNYRITAVGQNLNFKRYNEGWSELQTEVEYTDAGGVSAGTPGLYSSHKAKGAYYDWIRIRRHIPTPGVGMVDVGVTAKAQEEAPNIAEFKGMTVAPNGDLILGAAEQDGEYISPLINAPFAARVITPSWTLGKMGTVPEGDCPHFSVDISAREYSVFKENCENGEYYYASKKDFTEGNALRYRVSFASSLRGPEGAEAISSFTMDFRPGTLTVLSPNGGEKLEPSAKYLITWDGRNYDPSYNMKISYSADGGVNYSTIAPSAENSGQYIWVAPGAVTNRAVIRITDSLNADVYDVSDNHFTIGESPVVEGARDDGRETTDEGTREEPEEAVAEEEPEEEAAEEEPEEEERPQDGLYDLLIKIDDNPNEGGYKEGDIVMIKPAGFAWSDKERRNFLVVQAYLTDEKVIELVMPQGRMRRKHKIDLDKQGLEDGKIQAMRGLLLSKPLIGIEKIEEKE